MLDLIRVGAFLIGGLSVGAALPVLAQFIRRGNRQEAFVARLFGCIHISVVLFIGGVLAERAGDPLSWQTPIACAIFTAKLIALLILREQVMQRELRDAPPQRRAADLC